MQWTRPILRGVKASTFLLAALIVSSLVVIQSSRPSSAESLLYSVTCTVGALLQRDCPTKPVNNYKDPPPSSNASSPTTTPSNPDPKPQTNREPTTGPTVSEPPAQLDLSEAMVGDLSTVAVIYPVVTSQYRYPAHVLSFPDNTGGSGVLGTQSKGSVLEATDQGWRFLGLLWYWWVIMIGAVIGLVALIKTTVTNSFFSIVK